ncbi:MAG: outer membrane protein assembly factor BamB [Verrucomicrobiales bacterium]|jgi:outer membrane protein assembly factor BamB
MKAYFQLSIFILAFALILGCPGRLKGEDWPGFRGPAGMGVTTEKGLPLEWGGADSKNVLWKSPLPPTVLQGDPDHNQSSPVVVGGKVFVTTAHWAKGVDKTKQAPEHHIACYDAETGKQLWDTKVEAGPWVLTDLRGGYAAPTPCVAHGRVIAVFGSSIVHALDLAGKEVWSHTINDHEKFDVALPASPVIYKDTVILQLDKKKPASKLLALEVKTGKARWEKARPETEFSHMTPVLAQVGSKAQLIVCATDELQGVNPDNGEVVWFAEWGRSIWPVSSPVVANGLVYAIGGRGGHPGLVVDPTGTGDVSNTHVKWNIGPASEGLSSPVTFGEYVFRLNSPNVLRCSRISEGDELFKERLEGVNSSVSPIVDPDGRIYFACAGKTLVIQAGEELKVLAQSDLGDPSLAAAAVSGGRIFLKGTKFLYAIGKPQ